MLNRYGVASPEHQAIMHKASADLMESIREHLDSMSLHDASIFMLELQQDVAAELASYKLRRAILQRREEREGREK